MTATLPVIPLDQALSGAELADVFHSICTVAWHPVYRNRPMLADLAQKLMEAYGAEDNATKALRRAVQWIALAADHDNPNGYNAYHNPQHTAQVAMMTAYFCAQAETDERSFLTSLCAAFGHDIDHPGHGNSGRNDIAGNERKAAKITTDIMRHYGVDEDAIDDANVMILSTSPDGPHVYAARIAGSYRRKKPCMAPPALREQLRLVENPRLAELTAMLCDADIFMSAGTNRRLTDLAGRRLSQESAKAGCRINFNTAQARMHFLDHIVGKNGFSSKIARALANGNFQKLRKQAAQALKA